MQSESSESSLDETKRRTRRTPPLRCRQESAPNNVSSVRESSEAHDSELSDSATSASTSPCCLLLYNAAQAIRSLRRSPSTLRRLQTPQDGTRCIPTHGTPELLRGGTFRRTRPGTIPCGKSMTIDPEKAEPSTERRPRSPLGVFPHPYAYDSQADQAQYHRGRHGND